MAADQPVKYNSQIQKDQSDDSSAPVTQRVILYGWNAQTLQKVRLAADSSGNLQTNVTVEQANALSSAPLNGQVKVTALAQALGSNALTNGVVITAKSTNVGNVCIGAGGVTVTVDGTGNGYILEPGSSISFAVTNTNVLYVIGTANDVISFAGS